MPILTTATAAVAYRIRYSNRARNLSITVNWNGDCEVIVPSRRWISAQAVDRFLQTQAPWIVRQVTRLKKNVHKIPLSHQGISTQKVADQTRDLLNRVLDNFGPEFSYAGLKVRAYKSRWGSCDVKHRLCFNYKLSLLPAELSEYIVIHELCHTRHLNHSKNFWSAVEVYCPDYRSRRKELKKYLI
ncbi:M48 family metallopeptidase [Patescibacteria group bacterium]|nr:M48 family metallopeptidase [Patescibacteria group bacterium]MBU1705143.1 M48 family metallopeptidase [Patescibacteria group bacterium]